MKVALAALRYIAVMLLAFVIDTVRFYFWSALARPKSNVAMWLIVILLFNYVSWYLTFWLIGFAVSAVAYVFSSNVRGFMDIYISLAKEQYRG
jgi:hypothetical protein